jgi:hypothetical protein
VASLEKDGARVKVLLPMDEESSTVQRFWTFTNPKLEQVRALTFEQFREYAQTTDIRRDMKKVEPAPAPPGPPDEPPLDVKGNLWTFGTGAHGALGHGVSISNLSSPLIVRGSARSKELAIIVKSERRALTQAASAQAGR